jgi:putative Mn2+ efflux pump MntP
MDLDLQFFLSSILLGIGLAMDAFSVSLANGLGDPKMKIHKMAGVALVFALFQTAMPLIGWVCVSTVAKQFEIFEKFIPWIALALLSFIGGKMLYEGIRGGDDDGEIKKLTIASLLVQGVATSIDALSVGFTISEHTPLEATVACALIGVVTFFICLGGIEIGKKAGTRLSGKAGIIGGVILILIGLEIFITSWF